MHRIDFKHVVCVVISALLCFGFAEELTVITHDSFAISEDVIAAFTQETGIELSFIAAGDAAELVSKAILSKDNPLGDLLYGIDNSLLAQAIAEDIFEPYQSPLLSDVEVRYQLSPEGYVTPINAGFVNFNLDKAYFTQESLELPDDLLDLTKAQYRGLIVVENPATSSPGLAFMLSTINHFGVSGDYTWLDYWAELRDNDLLVTSGWNDAYYTAFSRYGGDRPIVLSYASSPAAEVIFAEEALETAPTLNLFCEGCVYQQIEAVGILKGSKKQEAAKAFIDYMLGQAFQEDIPLNMFVYPVIEGASLPEEFSLFAQVPSQEESVDIPLEDIATNLEAWLNAWVQVVEQGRSPDAVKN